MHKKAYQPIAVSSAEISGNILNCRIHLVQVMLIR